MASRRMMIEMDHVETNRLTACASCGAPMRFLRLVRLRAACAKCKPSNVGRAVVRSQQNKCCNFRIATAGLRS